MNKRGVIIGYRLFNRKGLTTQISKKTEIYSNYLNCQQKKIQNVEIKSIPFKLDNKKISIIETLEILQNLSKIEDINKKALLSYMNTFAQEYCDDSTCYVLNRIKYKKSTISILKDFLDYFKIKNTLKSYLSPLSKYAKALTEEIYETA